MSAPSGPEKCEPNLTPLLDLVLQLVMFFMLCANFDQLKDNEDLALPKASQATAPDKDVTTQLFVEMAGPSKVPNPKLPPGRGKWTLTTGDRTREVSGPSDLFTQMEAQARVLEIGKFAPKDGDKNARKKRVAVIMRIDKNVPFRQIYEAMVEIGKAGFEDVQLRAEQS